jgi:hypothetical protein
MELLLLPGAMALLRCSCLAQCNGAAAFAKLYDDAALRSAIALQLCQAA